MAYQQLQVPCPPNAWTQISEYRPTRKSLIVQCPQVSDVLATTPVIILSGTGVNQIVAADSLRRKLTIAYNAGGPVSGSVLDIIGPSTPDLVLFEGFGYNPTIGHNLPIIVTGVEAQSFWGGNIFSGPDLAVYAISVNYGCAALILATTQNASVTGPFGTQPPGNWLSGDLSAGPANFRLQEPLDGEQTIQAWYAWPVGSVTVNVTVSEAWTDNQPPPPPKTFRVDLPRLSTDAIAALNELLGKMSQYDEPGAANAA